MKNIIKIPLLGFILLSFIGISSALADNSCMRCKGGRELVCVGTPASTVLAKCGSPLAINVIGTKTKTHSRGTIYERQVIKKG